MSDLQYKNKKMKKSDFLRIETLFEKWWNWLAYLTIAYFFVFFSWNCIKSNLYDLKFIGTSFFSETDERRYFWKLPIFFILVLIRGLMFCADGLVTSWLKSPFSQICYSINKSGIDDHQSDEIITLMTEINEHFKETFKKFGILTVSTDLLDFYFSEMLPSSILKMKDVKNGFGGNYNSGEKKTLLSLIYSKFSDRDFLKSLSSLSLLVPVIFAITRILEAKKLIDGIEVEEDEE
ncbi:MAG: hypothetical protein AM1032_000077 [Mycoplasmataceae bacterium]|nr:MAG: hypothetical protein AM1032_000077 [Mycoplasmataceae bacterium]